MPLSSTEKSKALRKRRAKAGLKEIRGIWVTEEQERQLKLKIKEWLKQTDPKHITVELTGLRFNQTGL